MYLDYSITAFGTIPIILGVLSVSWLLYTLGEGIYNITFHPLAKYPGPKMWGAFWWPDTLSMVNGSHVDDVHNLHKKYGPVVRITPQTLSYTSAQAWKDIYGFRQGKGQLQKDPKFFQIDEKDKLPRNIILSNDADHSRYRRLLANAFSDQALRSQEPILNIYFDLLVRKLREQIDGPSNGKVNMVSWFNYTTFDILGDLAFGESFSALEGGTYHPWISKVFVAVKYSRWLRVGGRYSLFKSLLDLATSLFPSLRAARTQHLIYTADKVNRRIETDTDRTDFFHYILRHNDEKGMTRPEMVTNASVLIFAGSETTATLLSGATYLLLRNPEKLARLQQEVRSAFSSVDEMNLINVSKLPYLQAVLEESLRMYPPVPSMFPRHVSDGAMIEGKWVPADTTVGVHQWSTYRRPENFADPDSFVPERFLANPPAKYLNDDRDSLQPFSTGPRNCLGKNLAYNELRAIMARLIFCFDWELCPESMDWKNQKTYLLWEKGELMVQLRNRELKA